MKAKIIENLMSFFRLMIFIGLPFLLKLLNGYVPQSVKIYLFAGSLLIFASNLLIKKQMYYAVTTFIYSIVSLLIMSYSIGFNYLGILIYILSFFISIGTFSLANSIIYERGNFDDDMISIKTFFIHFIITIAILLASGHVHTAECAQYY